MKESHDRLATPDHDREFQRPHKGNIRRTFKYKGQRRRCRHSVAAVTVSDQRGKFQKNSGNHGDEVSVSHIGAITGTTD
jgi:hypothetical protein